MDISKKIVNINEINTSDDNNKIIILLLILFFLIILLVIIKYNFFLNKELFKIESKKYCISIMAIFKNEQDYMEEWINHHIIQGFEQIYLYCNDPYIDNYSYLFNSKYNSFIKIINWVDKQNNGVNTIQRQAYTHCVQNYSHQTQFLMMLDIDEFLIPIKHYNRVYDFIYSLKSNWDNICAFKIQRYDFGSNGHINKPKNTVLSSYTYHEKICSSFKTLVNTDYINKKTNFWCVHDFDIINDKVGKIYNNYFGYHETGFPNSCKLGFVNEIPLVINHYYTKSYEEYINRCEMWKNGGINPIGYRKDCENEFKKRDKNEIEGYNYLLNID